MVHAGETYVNETEFELSDLGVIFSVRVRVYAGFGWALNCCLIYTKLFLLGSVFGIPCYCRKGLEN